MAPINRLEQLLRQWEDRCYMSSLSARFAQNTKIPLAGPLVHWRDLRGYLLNFRRGDKFDYERFCGPLELQNFLFPDSNVPLEMLAWTLESRRVYSVSEDLQLLLEGTELGKFKVSDIPWPFDSFMITLATPLVSRNADGNDVCYDVILVSRLQHYVSGNEDMIEFRLLSDELDMRTELQPVVIRHFEEAFQSRRSRRMQSLLDRWGGAAQSTRTAIFSIDRRIDTLVSESVFGMVDRSLIGQDRYDNLSPTVTAYPHWDAAMRIVAGLALYLTTLKSDSPQRSNWLGPIAAGLDPRAIITTGQVCEVTSMHVLDSSERIGLRKAVDDERVGRTPTGASSTHFRRGHWRRPPGSGNDENAPKVVHVRPTIVRVDRLPDGAQPAGAKGDVR